MSSQRASAWLGSSPIQLGWSVSCLSMLEWTRAAALRSKSFATFTKFSEAPASNLDGRFPTRCSSSSTPSPTRSVIGYLLALFSKVGTYRANSADYEQIGPDGRLYSVAYLKSWISLTGLILTAKRFDSLRWISSNRRSRISLSPLSNSRATRLLSWSPTRVFEEARGATVDQNA